METFSHMSKQMEALTSKKQNLRVFFFYNKASFSFGTTTKNNLRKEKKY